jgi:hypothetical protein
MKINAGVRHGLLLVCCLYAIAASAADTTITGTVRNRTTGRPLPGENVLLLRMGEGQQERARTTTDDQGAFALNVASVDGQFIVRVHHQGVDYDTTVIGKNPLEINVFDAVTKIRGLSGTMGIAQVESSGKVLSVKEMYSIRNTSNPPVTQVGPRNFDISLPANATLDSFTVRSAATDWVKLSPVPVQGQKSRYGLDFPLRPGDTLVKYSYHLPDEGHTAFHIRPAYPIERFAVVHAPSMKFKAMRPGAFKAPGLANGMQLEEAIASPVVGEAPPFEISGAGALPPLPPASAAKTPPPMASAPPPVPNEFRARPAVPAPRPARPQPEEKALWPLIAGGASVLGLIALVVWRSRARSAAPVIAGQRNSAPVYEGLKEQLFRLEAERLNGSISMEKYASARKALDESIQRSIAGRSR